MFDPDLIESLGPVNRVLAKQALSMLAECGIIEQQRLRLFARVAEAADTGDLAQAAKDLTSYRQSVRHYLSLQELGNQCIKEREDEIENEE